MRRSTHWEDHQVESVMGFFFFLGRVWITVGSVVALAVSPWNEQGELLEYYWNGWVWGVPLACLAVLIVGGIMTLTDTPWNIYRDWKLSPDYGSESREHRGRRWRG